MSVTPPNPTVANCYTKGNYENYLRKFREIFDEIGIGLVYTIFPGRPQRRRHREGGARVAGVVLLFGEVLFE